MRKQAGFTLTETMLVLIVSSVLLGGAIVLYQQMREASAQTHARAKVQGLQATVETFMSGNFNALPSPTQVYALWQQSRSDFGSSPWGGPAPAGTATDANGDQIPTVGFVGLEVAANGTYGSATGSVPATGACLFYQPVQNNGTAAFYDYSRTGNVTVRGYSVSIAGKSGEQFLFVQGPR